MIPMIAMHVTKLPGDVTVKVIKQKQQKGSQIARFDGVIGYLHGYDVVDPLETSYLKMFLIASWLSGFMHIHAG